MKTNLDNLFKADESVEKNGVWFDIDDAVGFRLRRYNDRNPKVKAAIAKHFKPYARQIDLGSLAADKERDIMTKLFVDSCVIEWKGVEIDGEVKEYERNLAIKFFIELPELMNTLFEYAKDFANFREGHNEEDTQALGNS